MGLAAQLARASEMGTAAPNAISRNSPDSGSAAGPVVPGPSSPVTRSATVWPASAAAPATARHADPAAPAR